MLSLILMLAYSTITGGTVHSWRDCANAGPKELDCSALDLESVPKDLFDTPKVLIELSENPFICDCRMLWFVKKLRRKDYKQTIEDLSFMKCAKPTSLKNRRIDSLKEIDVCPEKAPAVDECRLRQHDCHKNADCIDLPIRYTCSCRTGFTGNGKICQDIDECKHLKCPEHSKCRNTLGSYTCDCDLGYTRNTIFCEDIDECNDGTAKCHRYANCENTQGSYRCACIRGYVGSNGQNCQVAKTCRSKPCKGLFEVCVDGKRPGEFECQCRPGFTKSSTHLQCQDINECRTMIHPCDQDAKCKNTRGSYKCLCPKGFFSRGHKCVDVDECTDGHDQCHRDAVCINNRGGYTCICRAGFQQFKSGRLCLKIENEHESNMAPIIGVACVVVILVIASVVFIVYIKESRKRKDALKKKPMIRGKSKKKWFSSMFPNNRVPGNESVLTMWSDSDEG